MKILKRLLIAAVVVFFFCIGIFYLFLATQGKTILARKLSELTHKKVSIHSFIFTSPFHLTINNLQVENLGSIDALDISFNPFGLLAGEVVLDEVSFTRPHVTYEKALSAKSESSVSLPLISIPAGDYVRKVREKKNRFFHTVVKRIVIKEGKMDFADRGITSAGIKITLKDINFNLNNIYTFPHSLVTNFELKAHIPWQHGKTEGKLESEGWINFHKKDMEATVRIQDIDGVYLYPYYANWVDLDKARIEKAKLNLTSNIHGFHNDVTVHYRLELADIVFTPRPPGEEEQKAEKIAHRMIDAFKTPEQENIAIEYTFRTKMNRLEFGFGSVKSAFEDKIAEKKREGGLQPQDVLLFPLKLFEGTFKGVSDVSKAVISTTFTVGNELKKSVKETFKK